MPMLDSLKDENGKLKKPILISLVGAGGLLAYLMLSKGGGGTTTSAGQSSSLTPDLSALQTALQGMDNGGGGGSGSGSGTTGGGDTGSGTGGGGGTGTGGNTSAPNSFLPVAPDANTSIVTPAIAGPLTSTLAPKTAQPTVPQLPGSNGSQGGGGGGTGQVIHPIAQSPTVYGGIAVPAGTGGVISTTPSGLPNVVVAATGAKKIVNSTAKPAAVATPTPKPVVLQKSTSGGPAIVVNTTGVKKVVAKAAPAKPVVAKTVTPAKPVSGTKL